MPTETVFAQFRLTLAFCADPDSHAGGLSGGAGR